MRDQNKRTDDSMKILVTGLSWQTQADGLKHWFDRFGVVKEVAIGNNFTGFVTFKDQEAAVRACHHPFHFIDGTRVNCTVLAAQTPSLASPYHQLEDEGIRKTPPPAYDKKSHLYHPYKSQHCHRQKDPGPAKCSGSGFANSYLPFKFLEMAMNLQICEPARNKNFVFSPCSIQLALCLVANGSSGSTLKEFLTVLEAKDLNHLNNVAERIIDLLRGETSEGGGPKLSFVGGVWVDNSMSLKQTFEARAKKTYRAKAKSVDFKNKLKEVTEEVNKWAQEATNGLIKSLIPPNISPTAILANAVYFKGTWSRKFYKKYIIESRFYLRDGSSVLVPFMCSYQDQYICSYGDFKILRLPYKRDVSKKASLSMYIILPNRNNGIWHLIEKIGCDPSFFDTYVSSLDHKIKVGELKLPKFKMPYDFDACEVLRSIGLKLPFTVGAEFDEMIEGVGLSVSQVIHKAYIEVNEEGTEAAAATAVIKMSLCARKPPQVDFVADHPFVFMVRDDSTGMLLFMAGAEPGIVLGWGT